MEWYALYIDGELKYIRQWFGKPQIRDFGVGEMYQGKYEIVQLATIGVGDTLGAIPMYRK